MIEIRIPRPLPQGTPIQSTGCPRKERHGRGGITYTWQFMLALFWLGMFVEAAIGNIIGKVSRPEGLVLDVWTICILLVWAQRSVNSKRMSA